jgi:peptide/nickel transport system substrate-binding protein
MSQRLLILLLLILHGCDQLTSEHEVTLGIDIFPSGLDPARNFNLFEYQIYSQIYEPLLTLDNDYKTLKPCLAESWSVSKDHLTYTFQLRPDVLFHDRTSLTAEVVQYAFSRQIRLRPDYPLFNLIESIRAVDTLTVEIILKHPYSPFLYTLSSPYGLLVVSKKALEKYGDRFDRHPSGSGPFYLDEWVEKDYITLGAFSDYREENRIDKIRFVHPENTSDPELLFKEGELDILYMVSGFWLDRLKWLGSVEYHVQKSLNTLFIGFNLDNDPVNNILIRRAILKAIDLKKTVLLTNRGNAIAAVGPLAPVYSGFDDLRQEEYDLDGAKKLLAAAGYNNGLSLNFYISEFIQRRKTNIEIIKSQLSKIGISLDLKYYNSMESHQNALRSENCHLFLDGYGAELIGDPGNFLYALFYSQSPNNWTIYQNKRVDSLLEQSFQEAEDITRHEIYREIVKLVLNDIPAIFYAHIKSHFAYNTKKIKSLAVSPYEIIYYHRLRFNE